MKLNSIRPHWLKKLLLASWLVATVLFVVILGSREGKEGEIASLFPESHFPKQGALARGKNCIKCHAQIHADWKRSDHGNANRLIDPSIDGIAFPSEPVVLGDQTWYFERNGNGVSVKVVEPGKVDAIYPVIGMIGNDPIWQYLVPFPDGRLQTLNMTFHVESKTWYPVFGEEIRHPGEWGHWMGQGMNWNANCAACHMTGYKKNYDSETNTYNSQWISQSITCMQCHGDMEAHAKMAQKEEYDYNHEPQFTDQIQMENCASCHSLRQQLTLDEFKPGERFDDHYLLSLPDFTSTYHEDGQVNGENYVYAAFRMSAMYEKGITCMDCHDPHGATIKLPAQTNELCMQCHGNGQREAIIIDPTKHSFHSEGSTGSQCVECHMPANLYMGKDWRRDHRFTSPDPALTAVTEIPNACNRCHEDKTVEWAVDQVEQWYSKGEDRRTHQRALLIRRYRLGDRTVVDDLIQMVVTEENSLWRAVLIRMAGDFSENPKAHQILLEHLTDSEPLVREAAVNGLARIPGMETEIMRLKNDPVRSVRIRVAEVLSGKRVLSKELTQELEDYFEVNSDSVGGNLIKAQYLIGRGKGAEAMKLLRRAIQFDPLNDQLYYQSALFANQIGENKIALAWLEKALELNPEAVNIPYSIALIYGETENFEKVAYWLQRSLDVSPEQGRVWYNLSIAYWNLGKADDALNAIEKAIQLDPHNSEYQYMYQIVSPSNRE